MTPTPPTPPAETYTASGTVLHRWIAAYGTHGLLLALIAVLVVLLPSRLTVSGLGLGTTGSPAFLLSTVTAAVWFLAVIVTGQARGRAVLPLRVITGVLILLAGTSYLIGVARLPTDGELASADRAMVSLLVGCGLALWAGELVSGLGILYAVRAVCLSAAGAGVVGLLQARTGLDYAGLLQLPGLSLERAVPETIRFGGLRTAGTATHPIEYGVLLACALPFCIHLGLEECRRSVRLVFWSCAAIVLAAIPTTLSRTGILGVALGLAVVCLGLNWRRQLAAFALMTLVGVTSVVLGAVPNDLIALFSGAAQDPSIQDRRSDYRVVLDYLAERPLLGRGTGTLGAPQYIVLDNQYLASLVEGGLLGLLALLLLLLTGVALASVALLRHRIAGDSTGAGSAAASLAAFSVVILAVGTFDIFAFRQATLLLFLLLGIIAGQFRLSVSASTWADRRTTC